MPSGSCNHLAEFKNSSRAHPVTILHQKLIHPTKDSVIRERNRVLKCRVCSVSKSHGRLHACLHCVFIGCYQRRHIHHHQEKTGHYISLDLIHGNVHCARCKDYVYDEEFDRIRECQAKIFCSFHGGNPNHYGIAQWEPLPADIPFLYKHQKRLSINGKTTVGLRGLVNQGNTCFMNVVLQALTHTPILRDYFLLEKHRKCAPGVIDSCIVCEMKSIFQEFFSAESTNPMTPYRLLLLVWRNAEYLAGYEQQDAHEFLIAALDMIHEKLAAPKSELIDLTKSTSHRPYPSSIIDQIFTGYMQSDVVCNKCGNISRTIDPLRDISLDIPSYESSGLTHSSAKRMKPDYKKVNLMDCLRKFTRKEQLGNHSKINCRNCGKQQESSKQLTMSRLPVVACFHLKRFEHTINGTRNKITTQVSFPYLLDMKPFMASTRNRSNEPAKENNDYKYELFAVVNHLGTLQSGHYTCYIRQNVHWFRCDDALITPASEAHVLSSEAYLLFYHKKNIKFIDD